MSEQKELLYSHTFTLTVEVIEAIAIYVDGDGQEWKMLDNKYFATVNDLKNPPVTSSSAVEDWAIASAIHRYQELMTK